MNWRPLFSSAIVSRGRQYYNAGKVKNLSEAPDGVWRASVWGSRTYRVQLELDENKDIMDMSCTCPYAADGSTCKHMAAVCMAVEKRLGSSGRQMHLDLPEVQAEIPVERPFKKLAASQAYFYFDLNDMTSEAEITNRVCDKGQKFVEQGKMVLEDVSTFYDRYFPNNEMTGTARGYFLANNRQYRIAFQFNREKLTSASCECTECRGNYYTDSRYGSKKLCSHEMGLLYMLEDYILRNNPGDATDLLATMMLSRYRRNHVNTMITDVTGDAQMLRIEPRLEKNGGDLSVSFKTGVDKLYMIKNLTKFVSQVENGESATFGKSTVIAFGQCQMDERTRKYYDFIKFNVADMQDKRRQMEMKGRYYYNYSDMDVKGDILLTGIQMDKLYELIQDRQVEYVDRLSRSKGKKLISCREGSIRPKLTITRQENRKGVFDGVHVSGDMPMLLEGNQAAYTVSDDGAYLEKIRREDVAEIMPLYELTNNSGSLSFDIGRKNLSEFYYTVLPVLKQYSTVEEQDSEFIEQYLPPEAAFRFYLDVEDDNMTCQAVAAYGENTVFVTDVLGSHKKETAETFRDVYREEEAAYRVLRFFPEVDDENHMFHCDRDEDAIYQVLDKGVEELMSFGEVHSTERFKRLTIRRTPKITVGVSVGSELMNLTVGSEDMSREELLEVLRSYRKKKKYVRLKNGDFVNLEEGSLDALGQMMDALHMTPQEFVKGKMQLPMYRALYLDKMLELNSGIYSRRDSHFRRLVKEFKTVSDSDFEVPESLQDTLRNYQVTGYKWLRTLEAYGFGGILADDMGLGKTIQMIAVFAAWKEEGKEYPSLVVSPASLVYNWQDELARFAPQLKVCMMAGSQRERREKLRHYNDYDVLVTSYDLLKRDIADYDSCHFHCQVLDEAQFIKNHTTAAAKAVKLVHSKVHYALTGTPIENRLSELWSIFDYLMPGFLYGYDSFKKELETPIVKNKDKEASERLRRMAAPFIMRRLKKDVLKDLPDKLEKVYYAELDSKQQKLYDGQVSHMQMMLESQDESSFGRDKLKILAELTRIRQICCDPALIFENYDGGSAKRETCMALVQQAMEGEHRMLIFSQFTSMLALLEEDLKAENIEYYKITGETPKKRRMELVRDFNEGKTPVFLISLKAGGTGLNLTGADVVIHYDPWWNLAVQNQATDRAHRIGQTNVVSVYRLIARGTIEEKILRMQEDKKNLADEILSGENGGLSAMSKEELMELLQV